MAVRKASRTISGTRAVCVSIRVFFVMGLNSDCWSTSWKASRKMWAEESEPLNATTGE